MKHNADIQRIIRQEINAALASLNSRPSLHYRIMSQIKGGKTINRKWSVGFILIGILLMSSLVALAGGRSYVIQYLFPRNASSPQAREMEAQVQSIDYVQRSGGTVCTVRDACFDGETLAVGLGLRTDRPIYLVADELLINGAGIDYTQYGSTIEEQWAGNTPFQQTADTTEAIHGVTCILARPLPQGETVAVTLRITLLAPEAGVQPVDIWQADKPAMWSQIDAVHAAGLTPISADEPYEVLISTGWFNGELDINGPLNRPLGSADALINYANMEVVDTLEVTFTLHTP